MHIYVNAESSNILKPLMQLYHDENKLHYDERKKMMMSALYQVGCLKC